MKTPTTMPIGWEPQAEPQAYVSTPSLPDDKGKALLAELWGRYSAIEMDPGTHKKVRRGSHEQRYAMARLQAALIKAGAHFERHRELGYWLRANHCEPIEAYDPIADDIEISNKLADFDWRLKRAEEKVAEAKNTWLKIVLDLVKRMPPETVKSELAVLEHMVKAAGI